MVYDAPWSIDLEVVAGAGFEPAIRRLPDYEPDGGVKPIIL